MDSEAAFWGSKQGPPFDRRHAFGASVVDDAGGSDAGSDPGALKRRPAPEAAATAPAPPPRAFVFGVVPTLRTVSLAQASLLGLLSMLSAAAAAGGVGLLFYLIVSCLYAPSAVEFTRPLFFDYGAAPPAAIAVTPLLSSTDASLAGGGLSPDEPAAALLRLQGGGVAAAALLPPGQPAALWVDLQLPGGDVDLLQVTGELLSADGSVVGRATRTWVGRRPHPLYAAARQLLTLPWAMLGWYDDTLTVRLTMFDRFVARRAAGANAGTKAAKRVARSGGGGGAGGGGGGAGGGSGVGGGSGAGGGSDGSPVVFRARLVGRPSAGGAPRVYSASVTVRLHLGWVDWFLFTLRPGPLLLAALAALGLALAAGGSGGALSLLLAAYLLYRWAAGGSGGGGRGAGQIAGGGGEEATVFDEGSGGLEAWSPEEGIVASFAGEPGFRDGSKGREAAASCAAGGDYPAASDTARLHDSSPLGPPMDPGGGGGGGARGGSRVAAAAERGGSGWLDAVSRADAADASDAGDRFRMLKREGFKFSV